MNVVGGVRLSETSVDLGVMAAVASSFFDKVIPKDTMFVGEVGLSGEVRAVSQLEGRLKEASALGFKRCFVPKRNKDQLKMSFPELKVVPLKFAQEMVDHLF